MKLWGQVLEDLTPFFYKPDAVLIVASGTPSTLPQLELYKRGYTGTIYQTQAVADNDCLRVGGKAVEATFIPVSPVLVVEQLPDSKAVRTSRLGLSGLRSASARYANASLAPERFYDPIVIRPPARPAEPRK